MGKALFFLALLCLAPLAQAVPFDYQVAFGHQIVDSGADFNASGWVFTESGDFVFSVASAPLDKFHFFDFVSGTTHLYNEAVPDGWNPIMAAEEDFSFKVSNLLGVAKPSLFLLQKNDLGLEMTHLEPGEPTTVVVSRPSKYYLLADIDDWGDISFSLEIGDFDIGVTADFLEVPDWAIWAEEHGMPCTNNPSDICLVTGGEEFNFSSCASPDSPWNSRIGEPPDLKICIQGFGAYREWYLRELEAKDDSTQVEIEEVRKTTAEELAVEIAELKEAEKQRRLEETRREEEGNSRIVWLLVAVVIVMLGGFSVVLYKKTQSPIIRKILQKAEQQAEKFAGKAKGEPEKQKPGEKKEELEKKPFQFSWVKKKEAEKAAEIEEWWDK